MLPITPVQQLMTNLYTAASVLVESVTDPEVIADAPLRHRVAAISAVSHLIATLNKLAAPPEASALPAAPPPEVSAPASPLEAVPQAAAPSTPANSRSQHGKLSAKERRKAEHIRRTIAHAQAVGAESDRRVQQPAIDPALRLTVRPAPVRAR